MDDWRTNIGKVVTLDQAIAAFNSNPECDVIVPVAAERARITVRRLVKIEVRKRPVWRDG
jgi:hypothetical protein